MTRDQVIATAREVGIQANVGCIIDGEHKPAVSALKSSVPVEWLEAFAREIADAERERIAAEFDRRAALSDGGPARGWYEPEEPAQIIRAMGDEPRQESEIYTPPPPTPEQLRINEMKRGILSRLAP